MRRRGKERLVEKEKREREGKRIHVKRERSKEISGNKDVNADMLLSPWNDSTIFPP